MADDDSQKRKDEEDAERSLVPYLGNVELEDRRGRGLILIADGDQADADDAFHTLHDAGYVCDIEPRGDLALAKIQKRHYDLLLTELVLDGVSGQELVRRAREVNPYIAIVVNTAHATVESAVEALKNGAADYLEKASDGGHFEDLKQRVHKAIAHRVVKSDLRDDRNLTRQSPFSQIIYCSDAMARVIERSQRIAATDATVLITGESGTGKELVAKAIHESSPRSAGRFVPINCAALSLQLLESELFGHEKGAFTGANSQRKGLFEHSHKGTIFLDEVGDIPLEAQVNLLRVLENREIIRVGSNEPIPIDTRVISATHRELENLVGEGAFREDLYYRLKVVTIHIPPLRDRPDDIVPLVDHYLRHFAAAYRKSFAGMDQDALAALVWYPWKGNVRELKHAIENVVVEATGREITRGDLPAYVGQPSGAPAAAQPSIDTLVGMKLKDIERELIRSTLARVNGNRHEAAQMLGIGERTLYRKLKLYSLK